MTSVSASGGRSPVRLCRIVPQTNDPPAWLKAGRAFSFLAALTPRPLRRSTVTRHTSRIGGIGCRSRPIPSRRARKSACAPARRTLTVPEASGKQGWGRRVGCPNPKPKPPQKPHVLLLDFLLAHIHPFSSAVRTASPCHTSFVPRSRVRTRNGR